MNTVSGFSRSVRSRGERQQRLLFDEVDLVEHEDQRVRPLRQAFEQCARPATVSAAASITSTIRSASSAPAQAAATIARSSRRFGCEDARRVDQQDLRVALDRDAHQPRARGLRLGADDRDLLADQRIDQGRLAGVGRADHGDEPGTGCARSLQLLQQRRRRGGLGFLLAALRPRPRRASATRHADGEPGRVVRAGADDDLIDGRLAASRAAASS